MIFEMPLNGIAMEVVNDTYETIHFYNVSPYFISMSTE